MSARKATKRAAKKSPSARAAAKRPATRSGAQAAGVQAARGAAPVLRPLPIYEFVASGLRGYVRLADPDRGIEFSHCLGAKSLPGPCKEVLSLRHYLARGEGGLLVPREEAPCEAKIEKQAVFFRYKQTARWPVAATARYDLLPEGGLDATFSFTATKGLQGFEAGVETLMPKTHQAAYAGAGAPAFGAARGAAYVHAGGRWTPAGAGPRRQRVYPRNLQAAELIADGRWNGLRMAGLGLAVEPQGYDYPMLVVQEANSHWALVYMALTEECSSIWVNGAERSLGLGLVGADLKPNTTAICRLRALLCQLPQLDDVLPYYRRFVQEARTTRRR